MAVRSINLKMILDRGDPGIELRRSLWLTHATLNRAVADIEQVLLLCRGRGYHTENEAGENEPVPAERVQTEALAFGRRTQADNGRPGTGSDEDIIDALQRFYEALVPSVLLDDSGRPQEGNAKDSGGFASPMMDRSSTGFQSVFEKILDPLPAWIAKMEEGVAGWEEESLAWLNCEESQRLQHASGSPPGWVRRLRRSQPWQVAFVEDQARKRQQTTGVPSLVRRMKDDLGLLPLMSPPIASQIPGRREGLTPWDRLALRLAVAHLLSWESWNHRANGEYGPSHKKCPIGLDADR